MAEELDKAKADSLQKELDKALEEIRKVPAALAKFSEALSKMAEACRTADRPEKVEPEVVKWEPADGDWVNFSGMSRPEVIVKEDPHFHRAKSIGLLRPTEESAEKSGAMIYSYSRLLAYVDEHKGDWEADWDDFGQPKWMVYQRSDDQHWLATGSRTDMSVLGTVYMPEHVARELADRLNKGEVEF